ncbi:MAG TPA: lytic murein transglycosylase [Candidatus Acidoferrales bacterium]|nr:lytic murein transglycosylase [Candidatus Acidoferrales bacterium]
MRRTVVLGLLLCVTCPAQAARADARGWGYLIGKLIADGVDAQRVDDVFQDPRVEPFTGLDFSLHRPREPRVLYRGFSRARTIAAARRCRAHYADAFESAERREGVPANLLAAILFVETGCGENTGSHVIFTRLARLAMADAPENIERNRARYADDLGRIDPGVEMQLRDRGRALAETFYPEVLALFTVAERLGVDPLGIRGSSGGAFGYPQFLPSSYLADGIDADGDGQVSLNDPADAAASCARFLVRHGWQADLGRAARRAVIWQYNHSDAYVDTVVTLAARIQGGVSTTHTTVAARKPVPQRANGRHTVRHVRRHRAAVKTVRS